MANMSYCRFENTYSDLKDCFESLNENNFDELSDREKAFAIRLVKLCSKFSDEFIDEAIELEQNSKNN
ncbi:hypothetical protein MEO93_20870 [Dolichospermum sp. ST_sed3]|nr:hypothetical protein [Dolichospermum sp. ST_sed3]